MPLTATPSASGTPAGTPAGTPVPAATPAEGTARMTDGTLLRTLHWPAVGRSWAVALVVHGLGEHGGRYGNVAAALTRNGIDVHAYDQRGFGGSAGRRAYVDRWSQFHDDLEERLAALGATQPGLPLILYGHSLGAMIVLGYVLSEPSRPLPDLLVLTSPAVDADVPTWQRVVSATLDGIVPRMRFPNGAIRDGLSHDPAIREAYLRDPLCLTRSTVHFGHALFAEQKRLQVAIAAIDRMPVPTYVVHGSEDPIVPARASEAIGSKGNVTRRVYEGMRHETHHEYGFEQVTADTVAWLEAQRSLLQAGGPPGANPPGMPEASGV